MIKDLLDTEEAAESDIAGITARMGSALRGNVNFIYFLTTLQEKERGISLAQFPSSAHTHHTARADLSFSLDACGCV